LFFAEGMKMAAYLSESFIPAAREGLELAKGFVEDWASLEPVIEKTNKENIWKKCLEFIGKFSKTMPGIFLENFDLTGFANGHLTLKSKNESVKKVFEAQFKPELIAHFTEEIAGFEITITEENMLVPNLPFVYFGGGTNLCTQGSLIVQTSINRFQGFDNFIISGFNATAYGKAIRFMENKSAPILTIQGSAGTGKSHMINSIAERLSNEDSKKKIAIYTIFSQPGMSSEITKSEMEEFEFRASQYDIIFVDNADHINSYGGLNSLMAIMKKWSDLGKKMVLSFREPFKPGMVKELENKSEHLFLNEPDEADKLKIIKSKSAAHNIKLTGRDILRLSEDRAIKSVADIQRKLARIYLTKEFKDLSRQTFLSPGKENINIKLLESSVFEYFTTKLDHPGYPPKDPSIYYPKIISLFINDLFISSHHGTIPGSYMPDYTDAVFYSLDSLQYYFFENEQFRRTVSEILVDLVSKINKKDF